MMYEWIPIKKKPKVNRLYIVSNGCMSDCAFYNEDEGEFESSLGYGMEPDEFMYWMKMPDGLDDRSGRK